jgi:carboxypeptidase C (cathepsin A)
MKLKVGLGVCVTVALWTSLTAWGLEPAKPADTPKTPTGETEAARPWTSVTERSLRIGGDTVAYTATAGTLILRDDKDSAIASMGYVAYTRRGVEAVARRPITFAFNGGPGSSSIWLHIGALGPRRVRTSDAVSTPPPPYEVVDNAYSLIDVTDLVLIDPVGTGVSRAVGKKEDKDFWGVDPDIRSVSQFIVQYVTDNDRWGSPKYLLGESYGTTRAAGVVNWLQSERSMAFNGVVLISLALDMASLHDDGQGPDLSRALRLPSYAAAAYYHHALADPPARLEAFLEEARQFAFGPYSLALLKGDRLSPEEAAAVATRMSHFTGLSVDYCRKANLRVTPFGFAQELLRQHRTTVGLLDARFVGVTSDPLAQDAANDPADDAIGGAFVAAFLDYYYRELKVERSRSYTVVKDIWQDWSWAHKVTGGTRGGTQPVVNTGADLALALIKNPGLQVLALNGTYDLVTPFAGAEYMLSHLGLPPEIGARIHAKYYEAGHMMYLHEPALAAIKSDLAELIAATSTTSARPK